MLKKRTSPESSRPTDEEVKKEGSDAVFQQAEDRKRVKLTSYSDTTFEDLPLELIERILVRAITMEVEEMHLAKSVWKEKADLVVNRLRTVSPYWSNIFTTNLFQNELYRTLDRNVQKFRFEILHQFPTEDSFEEAITFKDELFMLVWTEDGNGHAIHVYDRSNLAKVKDVIPLPGIEPKGIATCNVSNCLYVLNIKTNDPVFVVRIAKEDEHKFKVSPLISGRWKPDTLSLAANGNLILSKLTRSQKSAKVAWYDHASGSLQRKIKLSTDLYKLEKLIPRSNGNLVFVSRKARDDYRTRLVEIDTNGTVLRQYESSISAFDSVCQAGPHGRIAIIGERNRVELLDAQFNLLDATIPQLGNKGIFFFFSKFNYNSDRNEMITTIRHMTDDDDCYELQNLLSMFRFSDG